MLSQFFKFSNTFSDNAVRMICFKEGLNLRGNEHTVSNLELYVV
jgi:hypothetical protein